MNCGHPLSYSVPLFLYPCLQPGLLPFIYLLKLLECPLAPGLCLPDLLSSPLHGLLDLPLVPPLHDQHLRLVLLLHTGHLHLESAHPLQQLILQAFQLKQLLRRVSLLGRVLLFQELKLGFKL